jgi:HK97 family phage portal protein
MALFGRNKKQITAQVNPAVYDAPFGSSYAMGMGGFNNWASPIDRQAAVSVPAVNQCLNLIKGTIATIPMEMYSLNTGEEIAMPTWVRQPDSRAPRSVTIAWTVDSLIMFGQAFWRVTSVYADDQRPASFEWIQNNRVTTKLDTLTQEVDYYMVNGTKVPDSGVGSLVTFQAFDQGLLVRSQRLINSAIQAEEAANVGISSPQPTGYLKNSGADLPDGQIQGLLNTWKQARKNRSVAYLTSTLEYVPTSYSPEQMTYNQSIEELAAQVARAFNIPAHMINAEHNRSSTYQNVLDSRKEFFAYSLAPYISAIEDRLSLDDLTPRGQIVRFAVDETFLRANPQDRLAVTEKLLSLQLISLDQAKEMEGLAPDGSESSMTETPDPTPAETEATPDATDL